ncbi:MAG: OmpP1/FadL family transporter [Steroidobacterales bacterium]
MASRLLPPRACAIACSAVALGAAASAQASGFALLEQSGAGLGRAFAGSAAVAEDASTVFFNAAGLSRLERSEISVAAVGVDISSRFNNAASQPALGQPLGGNGGQAGALSVLPSVYVAWRINPALVAGFGVNVPFGLKTDYDAGWIGRFQALRSELHTVNYDPELAWQVTPQLSVGVGVDYQHVNATLTSAVNDTAVIAQVSPAAAAANLGAEGTTHVGGNDSAWGYNLGALYSLSDATRLGLAYRSAIQYSVQGTVQFSAPALNGLAANAIMAGAAAAGGPLSNGDVRLALKVPQSATASLAQKIGEYATVYADAAWTGWSSLQELRVVRAGGPAAGSTLALTPEKWKSTWRFAIGADCRMSEQWTLRSGVALDQSPVPDATRTPRLPDRSRTWLAVGTSWSPSPSSKLDLGYAHLFLSDASLNQDAGSAAAYGLLNGSQRSHIDIVGLQGTVRL